MDQATKAQAFAAFDPRIGHPLKCIDYASLNVVRGDPVGNAMRSGEFQHRLDMSPLCEPVDCTLWGMTPQTVNAYYDPLNNQIIFPGDPAATLFRSEGGCGGELRRDRRDRRDHRS